MVKNMPVLRRPGFDPWVAKTSWRRAWNQLQYACLENPHGQRSPVGFSPWGCKDMDMTQQLGAHTHTHIHTHTHTVRKEGFTSMKYITSLIMDFTLTEL